MPHNNILYQVNWYIKLDELCIFKYQSKPKGNIR